MLALLITLFGLLVTPLLINIAYVERGYYAFGGEYLFAPLCMVIALIVINTARVHDEYKKGDQ